MIRRLTPLERYRLAQPIDDGAAAHEPEDADEALQDTLRALGLDLNGAAPPTGLEMEF